MSLTIGQLAERSGVATSALRFYESRGLISLERTTGNQRRYLQSTLRRVAFIRTAQRVGLSLEEIGEALATLARQPDPDEVRLAPAQPGLATAAGRADPADRAAPRAAGRLHRLRLPQPEELRADEPRRRARGGRSRRRSGSSRDRPPAARAAPRRVAALPVRRGARARTARSWSGCAPTRRPGGGGLDQDDVRRGAGLPPVHRRAPRRQRGLVERARCRCTTRSPTTGSCSTAAAASAG